jgi:hemolysin activation/secretion protein
MSVQKWLLRLNVEGQYATVPLISGEQFGVGGSRSVRGYNEREILGDRGIGLSFEVGQSVEGTNLRWLVFYDVAQTEYVEDFGTGVSQALIQDAASIGGGVRWSWSRYFNASADLAQVLEDFGDTESGDIKLHFNMTYQY